MNAEIARLQKCCDEQCEQIARAMQTNNPLLLVDALARQQVYSKELDRARERYKAAQGCSRKYEFQSILQAEQRRQTILNANLDGTTPVKMNATVY